MANDADISAVGRILVNPKQDLSTRFRALFTLRNLGGPEAITWISEAFVDESALLKHELAYCLGQMQDERAIPILETVLKDTNQEPMVRHEAGETYRVIFFLLSFLFLVIRDVIYIVLLYFKFQEKPWEPLEIPKSWIY